MAFSLTFTIIKQTALSAAVLEITRSYLERCGRVLPSHLRAFRNEAALLAFVQQERKAGACGFWIADLHSTQMDSVQFARRIQVDRDGGLRQLVLAVGPADGWSAAARSAADLRLSLGAMTLPHELAALVLAEQIYRASTILQGHPYHLGH